MNPVTVWKRFNVDSQKWDHNHIEDGHIGTMDNQYLKPIGDDDQTRSWAKGTWIHLHEYLVNGRVQKGPN